MTDMVTKDFQVTVDAVIIKQGNVLLMKRNTDPFKGYWALPGGRVDTSELLVEAVKRETKEETGITIEPKKIIGVYDALDRDPRCRSISTVFLCEAIEGEITQNKEAQDIQWFLLDNLPQLAFDHEKMVRDTLAMQGL